jgi:hypothetical protein
MSYADNTLKTTVLVNRKHEPGLVLNAVTHLVAGLVDVVGNDRYAFLDYDFDLDTASRLSTYPMIVLAAPNSSQVLRTWEAAREHGLPCNLFTTTMIGRSAQEQRAATRATPIEAQDAVALAIFGEATRIDPLTRKFSVYR